jgi:serine/threonine protein kinase
MLAEPTAYAALQVEHYSAPAQLVGLQAASVCHLFGMLRVLLCPPHAVLAHGYNYSVDWWGLGVLTYVLLTGRQPFSSPKTDDPMVVMRRIVDENYTIKYPPFLSPHAKVGWHNQGLRYE